MAKLTSLLALTLSTLLCAPLAATKQKDFINQQAKSYSQKFSCGLNEATDIVTQTATQLKRYLILAGTGYLPAHQNTTKKLFPAWEKFHTDLDNLTTKQKFGMLAYAQSQQAPYAFLLKLAKSIKREFISDPSLWQSYKTELNSCAFKPNDYYWKHKRSFKTTKIESSSATTTKSATTLWSQEPGAKTTISCGDFIIQRKVSTQPKRETQWVNGKFKKNAAIYPNNITIKRGKSELAKFVCYLETDLIFNSDIFVCISYNELCPSGYYIDFRSGAHGTIEANLLPPRKYFFKTIKYDNSSLFIYAAPLLTIIDLTTGNATKFARHNFFEIKCEHNILNVIPKNEKFKVEQNTKSHVFKRKAVPCSFAHWLQKKDGGLSHDVLTRGTLLQKAQAFGLGLFLSGMIVPITATAVVGIYGLVLYNDSRLW